MIFASYKEDGEVKCCYPCSVLHSWNENDIGKKFKSSWNYAPGKNKQVEYTVRECQCYEQPAGKADE